MTTNSDKVPVTILTGYLGSGKTTFVNYLLKEANATSYLAVENTINYANPKSYEVSRVCLQKYIQSPYSQRNLDDKDYFIPNLSCLDLLASENISNVMKILEESNSWTYFNN